MYLLNVALSAVPTISFGCMNLFQIVLNVQENISPEKNWGLYSQEFVAKLNPTMKKKLKHIEEIKNQVCELANISREKVSLELQSRGIFENHGNANRAVLGISYELLKVYQPKALQTKVPVLKTGERFQSFLDSLPDEPNELKKAIYSLKLQDKEDYLHAAKFYFLNLTDSEIKFIISHEILGHMMSNDTAETTFFSALFGGTSWTIATLADIYLPFTGSGWLYQSALYSISQIALQSVITHKQEKSADIKALLVSENIQGGISFFKRLMVLELLQNKAPENYEKKSFFDFSILKSHESADKRLLRCLETKKVLLS